MQKQNARNLG